MKTLKSLLAVAMLAGLFAGAGCGIAGTDGGAAFPDTSATSEDSSPRFVTPVDGSSGMVFATPMGGNMYQSVTGGMPFMGM